MKYIFFLFLCLISNQLEAQFFVTTSGTHFELNKKEYKYIGCNYWYGGYLLQDKKRLQTELDFLQKNKITNLRVFISSEGDSSYAYRIFPSIQETQGVYNENLLIGFDYFLMEAKKRNMKIIFVLNNNWEWSGGFAQYLQWNGYGTPPLPKTNLWDWDAYCTYISQFYSSVNCKKYFHAFIEKVVTRKNSFTKEYYYNNPTIMAYELANEPRPMKKEATLSYINWVNETASFIKQLDKNHLVTIGVEGVISTFYEETLFKQIHSLKNIDYATIHLWPKTWQWYNAQSIHSVSDTTLLKTKKYITQHATICNEIKKPLVIEEFGLHRDGNSFSCKASVEDRNKYFEYIFTIGNENKIAGYNFWGFAGVENNTNEKLFMQKGMPYSADPSQEEQGLYSVFMKDTSTWNILEKYQLLNSK